LISTRVVSKKDSLHLLQMKPAGSTEVIHGVTDMQEAEEEAKMDTKDAAMEAVATEAVAEMEMEITTSTKLHRQLKSRDSSSQKRMPKEPRGTRQSSIILTL
jgi:hypothetical protein